MVKEIILFQHTNFKGPHHHVFANGDNDLRASGFNDKVSSFIIKSGQWAFYKDINYKGTRYPAQPHPGFLPGYYSNCTQFGVANDAVSSVRVE
jgi:hypothetical protein